MLISIENPDDADLERIRACLTATAIEIEGVIESSVYDALPINNSPYRLVWDTLYADDAALERYRDHPYHTKDLREVFTAVSFSAATAFFATV